MSSSPGARRGRHWLAGLALVLAASFAWALPTPKDIEQAVNAGEYRQAETMLREVLKEKPHSPKAHYQLGEVLAREGRNGDARQALLEAQRLDPSLKFASDPQRFRQLLDKIPLSDSKSALPAPASASASPSAAPLNSPAAPAAPVAHSSPASAPASGGGFPWFYLVIAAGVLFAVWKIASRVLTPPAPAMAGMGAGSASASMGGNGFGRAPTAPGYGQAPYGQPGYGQPGYGAPASSGPGIGGVVLGGLAGAAAGYGLAKVLEHGDESRSSGQAGAGSGSGTGHSVSDNSAGYVPIDNPPDYGAFDAGSGASDSWDSGGDAGGSDDNNW